MMDYAYVDAGWPRQQVAVVAQPSWPLPHPGQAWLLLFGDRIPSLANDIRSLSVPGDHHWVWRGTADEYAGSGYQAGPLLVRLDERLLKQFLDTWGPQQDGLILFGPDEPFALLEILKQARNLKTADGNTLVFQWRSLRKLEEFCEALPHDHLQQLFSPILRLIWHSGLESESWLQQAMGENLLLTTVRSTSLALTSTDETALNSACHAWFLRNACHVMGQHLLALGVPFEPQSLRRQLADYDQEAQYCGFHLEHERSYYMQLRLLFPEEPFVKDRTLYNLLLDTDMQGQQRLMEINDRLLDISSPITARDPQ